jgi:cell wall-associated NlpC family hydrolase
MAAPFLTCLGLFVGALSSMAVVLGGTVATISIGPSPAPTGPSAAIAPSGNPALNPALQAEVEQAAATCPGLDWALLGGAVLIDPAVAGSLTSAATDLCLASDRAAALSSLLPGPTPGQVALVLAHALDADPSLSATAAAAITFAATNLGAPYRWGGTGAGGFDCSGLVLQAYRAAGVTLPRVAQDQYDHGPSLPAAVALEPGDLVFFGGGPGDVSHVGLYIGGGEMIDAPHTGAFVRVEATPITPGAHFGSDIYVGATRPAG